MNIPPNPVLQGADVQNRLKRQTTGWLRENDPARKAERLKAKSKRRRERIQARENPALVAAYRKAMLR